MFLVSGILLGQRAFDPFFRFFCLLLWIVIIFYILCSMCGAVKANKYLLDSESVTFWFSQSNLDSYSSIAVSPQFLKHRFISLVNYADLSLFSFRSFFTVPGGCVLRRLNGWEWLSACANNTHVYTWAAVFYVERLYAYEQHMADFWSRDVKKRPTWDQEKRADLSHFLCQPRTTFASPNLFPYAF